MRLCAFPDCGRRYHAHDLCRSHYEQKRRGYTIGPLRKPQGGRRRVQERKAAVDLSAVEEPVTQALLSRVEAEVAAGIRCRCYLRMPCLSCIPARRAA